MCTQAEITSVEFLLGLNEKKNLLRYVNKVLSSLALHSLRPLPSYNQYRSRGDAPRSTITLLSFPYHLSLTMLPLPSFAYYPPPLPCLGVG